MYFCRLIALSLLTDSSGLSTLNQSVTSGKSLIESTHFLTSLAHAQAHGYDPLYIALHNEKIRLMCFVYD